MAWFDLNAAIRNVLRLLNREIIEHSVLIDDQGIA